jgi:hypothetical protein
MNLDRRLTRLERDRSANLSVRRHPWAEAKLADFRVVFNYQEERPVGAAKIVTSCARRHDRGLPRAAA